MPVDEVEREHDAVMLHGGLGACGYLALDGRILIGPDEFGDEPVVREAKDDDEAIAILVIGAKVTGIDELFELVPAAPADAMICPVCSGSRWWQVPGGAADARIICPLCRGRAWATQAMFDANPNLRHLVDRTR